MQTHIEQTLQDIDSRISRLSDLKDLIRLQLDDSAREAISELKTKAEQQSKPRKTYTRRTSPDRDRSPVAATRAGKGSKKQRAQEINDAIRKLAEPFTPNQVRDAIGVVNGSSTCNRLEKFGLIKRTGKGQYVRTAKFPTVSVKALAAAELAKAHPVAAPDQVSQSDLKDQLAHCLEQRDNALARWQYKIVRIYQARVTKLEAQIND